MQRQCSVLFSKENSFLLENINIFFCFGCFMFGFFSTKHELVCFPFYSPKKHVFVYSGLLGFLISLINTTNEVLFESSLFFLCF